MIYSFPSYWTLDGFHYEPNSELSGKDKISIATEKWYPGKNKK